MRKQKHLIWSGLIFAGFIITRLIFIYRFPLFFDEAIYIHWAQYVSKNWVWRNVSLSLDGKQPLFIWLVALSLKIIQNPIIAGRIISVISGAISLTGIYLLAKKIYNQRVALISILLYTLIPFFLIYDSLALMDGILLTLSIYVGLFTIFQAAKPGLLTSLGFGIVIGLGLLTKSSASFFIATLPLGVLVFTKQTRIAYIKYSILGMFTLILAKGIEYIFLHQYFKNISSKNAEFIMNWAEFTKIPLVDTFHHTVETGGWLVEYLGIIVIGLSIIGLMTAVKKRPAVFLWFLVLLPLIPYLFLSKQAYPRHLLFMIWPLLILASSAIVNIYHKINYSIIWIFIIILIVIVPALWNSSMLLFSPLNAKLPEIDRWQYINGEPSGWGMDKLYRFFDARGDKKLLILTDKPSGILPDGIAIRYFKTQAVKAIGLDEVNSLQISRFKNEFQPDEVFMVMSWQNLPDDIPAHKEFEIERPGIGNKNWRIYKLQT